MRWGNDNFRQGCGIKPTIHFTFLRWSSAASGCAPRAVPCRLLCHPYRAQEAVILHVGPIGDPGREVQRVRVPAIAAVTELQPPQPGDADGAAIRILQRAEVTARERIECVDGTVPQVSYQQGADVVAEEGGRKRNSPWRIQYAVGNGPSQQLAIGGEYIDKPFPGPVTSRALTLSCST